MATAQSTNQQAFQWHIDSSKVSLLWLSINRCEDSCEFLLWLLSPCEDMFLPQSGGKDTPLRVRPGSSEGRSPLVSRFSRSLFLEVPGTATEQVRTCGFRRNSSSFDKAPKILDSVLLNSFESFFVTLPPISSET